ELAVGVARGVVLGETVAREARLAVRIGGARAVPGAQGALPAVDPVAGLLRVVAFAAADEPESRLRHCCSPAPAMASPRATRASRSPRRVPASGTPAAGCPQGPPLSKPGGPRMGAGAPARRSGSTRRSPTSGPGRVTFGP